MVNRLSKISHLFKFLFFIGLLISPLVTFSATASITQSGGEVWTTGERVEVTWNSNVSSADQAYIYLEVVRDDRGRNEGKTYKFCERTQASGSCSWTVGNELDGQLIREGEYKLRVAVLGDDSAIAETALFSIDDAVTSQACTLNSYVIRGEGSVTPEEKEWSSGSQSVSVLPASGSKVLKIVIEKDNEVIRDSSNSSNISLNCNEPADYEVFVAFEEDVEEVQGCPIYPIKAGSGGYIELPDPLNSPLEVGESIRVTVVADEGYEIDEGYRIIGDQVTPLPSDILRDRFSFDLECKNNGDNLGAYATFRKNQHCPFEIIKDEGAESFPDSGDRREIRLGETENVSIEAKEGYILESIIYSINGEAEPVQAQGSTHSLDLTCENHDDRHKVEIYTKESENCTYEIIKDEEVEISQSLSHESEIPLGMKLFFTIDVEEGYVLEDVKYWINGKLKPLPNFEDGQGSPFLFCENSGDDHKVEILSRNSTLCRVEDRQINNGGTIRALNAYFSEDPSGFFVEEGDVATFTARSDEGYLIDNFTVEGEADVGAVNQRLYYVQSAVCENERTITASVSFKRSDDNVCAVYHSTQPEGEDIGDNKYAFWPSTFYPEEPYLVVEGRTQAFSVRDREDYNNGYRLYRVLLDGETQNLQDGDVEIDCPMGGGVDFDLVAEFKQEDDMPPEDLHIITSSVEGEGGTIEPLGEITLLPSSPDQAFKVQPDSGYEVDWVKIDGRNVVLNQDNTYTLDRKYETIRAKFKEGEGDCSITTRANRLGVLTPYKRRGTIKVPVGESQIFNIDLPQNFIIEMFSIDGVPQKHPNNEFKTSAEFECLEAGNHDVSVSLAFDPPDLDDYIIDARVEGEGGIVDPQGEIRVDEGDSQIFNFIAEAEYILKKVLLDGSDITSSVTGDSVTVNDNGEARRSLVGEFDLECKGVTPRDSIEDIFAGRETYINQSDFRQWVTDNEFLLKTYISAKQCYIISSASHEAHQGDSILEDAFQVAEKGIPQVLSFAGIDRAHGDHIPFRHAVVVLNIEYINDDKYTLEYLDPNRHTSIMTTSCDRVGRNNLPTNSDVAVSPFKCDNLGLNLFGHDEHEDANIEVYLRRILSLSDDSVRSDPAGWLRSNSLPFGNQGNPDLTEGGVCDSWSRFNVLASQVAKECPFTDQTTPPKNEKPPEKEKPTPTFSDLNLNTTAVKSYDTVTTTWSVGRGVSTLHLVLCYDGKKDCKMLAKNTPNDGEETVKIPLLPKSGQGYFYLFDASSNWKSYIESNQVNINQNSFSDLTYSTSNFKSRGVVDVSWQAPVRIKNVHIVVCYGDGTSDCKMLAKNTPNDGSESVRLPVMSKNGEGRLYVFDADSKWREYIRSDLVSILALERGGFKYQLANIIGLIRGIWEY